MKRLLLAPLLIALAGCSSDLVVKTDLGEKYLVKASAATTVPNSLDDLISVMKKDAMKVREKYRRCVVKYGERKEGKAYSYCERTYAFFNGFLNKHSADLNLIELSQKIEDVTKRAKTNSLDPGETNDATITFTNFGHTGASSGNPLINPPQVSIIGTGKINSKVFGLYF